jgi:hypothetical protein
MGASIRALIATAALSVVTSATVPAQSTKGVFFGLQYAGSSLSVKSAAEALDFGGGFGLHAGLGLSDTWSVVANFDRSVLTGGGNSGNVTVSQYDALLRMHVLPGAGSPLRLYVTGGATARSANAGRSFEEIAPTAGAGVHLFLTPKLALNGTALWTLGRLTRASGLSANDIGEQFQSTQARVQAGVSLYLFAR